MTKPLTEQDVKFFIKLANKDPSLSDWDINFIESIELQIEEGRTLTLKQQAQLRRIALND